MTHAQTPMSNDQRPAAPMSRGSTWCGLAIALAIIALTCLAYGRAFNAGFIWDDDHYITENRHLESLEGLRHIWFSPGATWDYYPLAFTTHWLEHRLWGHWAPGYHAVNILMHAGNAILLWRLLCLLGVRGGALAGLLFALHPVQVESVVWCTERKTLLAAMMGLLAFHALLRHRPVARPSDAAAGAPAVPQPPAGSSLWLVLALIAFVAAVLAKVTAVTFPAAMAFVLWWREGPAVRRRWPALVAMLALAAPICWLAMWTQTHIVGAEGEPFDLSWSERGLLVGRTSAFYLTCLAWPVRLVFIHPRWEVDAAVWWQWLFPAAAVGLVVALWLARRRVGVAPLAVLLAYGVMLGPALGVFKIYWQVYSYVADHVQYAAAAAPLALLAAGVAALRDRLAAAGALVLRGAVIALIVTLGLLTAHQTRDYHDLETLWRRTLMKNPAASIAHNNLAAILLDRGRPADAEAHLRQAIQLRPNHVKAMAGLGRALFELNRVEEALPWLQRAIDHQPPVAGALNTLGVIHGQRGDLTQAIDLFRRASRADPNWPDPHFNLGAALHQTGDLDLAEVSLRRALALRNKLPTAHYLLAEIYSTREDGDKALAHYIAALELAPQHSGARRGLGALLMMAGRPEEALPQLEWALRGNPNDARAWQLLGLALASLQRWPEAQQAIDRANQLDPSLAAESHNRMGVALSRAGRLQAATAALEQALRLRPDYPDARRNLQTITQALASATQPQHTATQPNPAAAEATIPSPRPSK